MSRDRHVAWSYFNQVVGAPRFFYREVLKKNGDVRHIPYQKTGRKLKLCSVVEEQERKTEGPLPAVLEAARRHVRLEREPRVEDRPPQSGYLTDGAPRRCGRKAVSSPSSNRNGHT